MERELNLPLDLSNHNPVLIDGFPSQVLTDSLVQSTFFGFSSQDQFMTSLPMVSTLLEDPMSRNHGDTMSSNELLISNTSALGEGINIDDLPGSSQNVGNRQLHDLCIGGAPIASSSLANDISNLAISLQHDVPSEVFEAFGSNSYSNASTSSIVPLLNCENDGLVGDVNNKWNLDKFLIQQEFNWKTGFQPIQFGEPNEWISQNDVDICPRHPYASSNPNSKLSLSLGTCGASVMHEMNAQDQGSDTHGTSGTSRELSGSFGSSSSSIQFTQILSGSRYRHVAQEILTEIASYSYENTDQKSLGSGADSSSSSYYPFNQGISLTSPDENLNVEGLLVAPTEPSSQRREAQVKSQLLSLLQMVDDRYNQCLDEIHTVVSAFHAATELDPQIHTRFALFTVSFMYKNLRERISREILRMGMHVDNGSLTEKERSFEKSFIQKQWALQQLKRKDHQLWRPQRGLPERSVSVLRAWMFQNFLHPYPKDAEKHLLAIRSGLTRSQVSNWFINARVRLWKPLIEEMYAELNRKKARQNEDGAASSNRRSHLNINNQRFSLD
ncbi:hypothetical protein Ancab_002029 [Ancistrocladus abbreviatus]